MTALIISQAFLLWLGGFFLGIFALFSYMVWRMMKNDGWDDSNMTNAIRLISHVVLHPHDFGKMWYVRHVEGHGLVATKRPFWYVELDEFSEVVDGRPE